MCLALFRLKFEMVQVDVEGIYERLLTSSEDKDVEIKMADGSLWAHSVILSASSDAIAGMLKNGIAATSKQLNWQEHPMIIGRFVLRLMYTGTLAPEEWKNDSHSSSDIPLQFLLGGIAISKMYMMHHVLAPLTKAVQERISLQTFNDILTFSIKQDVSVLRFGCMQLATQPGDTLVVEGCGLKEFNGVYRREGQDIGKRKYRMIDGSCHTINQNEMGNSIALDGSCHTIYRWFVSKEFTSSFYFVEANTDEQPSGKWAVGPLGVEPPPFVQFGNPLHHEYRSGKFSPEVMTELSPFFDDLQPPQKRRRKL